ncbi:hypothetical protein NM688_g922 [Phlebia brevispora]|uniref:Uncharacterized protein n=1 Tax=Phlebia brevispora TaxID=194682 RepID=A0ACC1TCY4_9APHY|nr:hypothetical protein NM688_g922 [Phlebia brevispora]
MFDTGSMTIIFNASTKVCLADQALQTAVSPSPTSRRAVGFAAPLVFLLAPGAYAPPPCTNASMPQAFCVEWSRPYSDNAYFWATACDLVVPSNELIGDNVEMYDVGYPCSSDHIATCCTGPGGCSVVNCDVETPLPTPITDPELPEAWVPIYSCAVDNASRVITDVVVQYTQANTPYYCTSYCASLNYRYAGVEYGDECYCGTGLVSDPLPIDSNWVTAHECAIDNASRVITAPVIQYTQANTPYFCTTYCESLGWPYAGVEYGDGAGVVGGIQGDNVQVSSCDMRCPGDYNDQISRKVRPDDDEPDWSRFLSVLQMVAMTTLSHTAGRRQSDIYGHAAFYPAFYDNPREITHNILTMLFVNVAALLIGIFVIGASASPPCTTGEAYCVEWSRPYSDNAWFWENVCGLSAPSNELIGDNVEIYDEGYPCGTGYVATCCTSFGGCGNVVNCDVETSLPTPITDPELPESWVPIYSCAIDNASRVITDVVVQYTQANTPYYCTSYCASLGYQYAGVEYGDECYCGTGLVSGIENDDSSSCDMRCPGDYMFLCGGSWRMQIYYNP